MTTIATALKEQIDETPSAQYAVLITLKQGQLPHTLENKGKFVLSNEIYSARITGDEINELANDDGILAIEGDIEMGIL